MPEFRSRRSGDCGWLKWEVGTDSHDPYHNRTQGQGSGAATKRRNPKKTTTAPRPQKTLGSQDSSCPSCLGGFGSETSSGPHLPAIASAKEGLSGIPLPKKGLPALPQRRRVGLRGAQPLTPAGCRSNFPFQKHHSCSFGMFPLRRWRRVPGLQCRSRNMRNAEV